MTAPAGQAFAADLQPRRINVGSIVHGASAPIYVFLASAVTDGSKRRIKPIANTAAAFTAAAVLAHVAKVYNFHNLRKAWVRSRRHETMFARPFTAADTATPFSGILFAIVSAERISKIPTL